MFLFAINFLLLIVFFLVFNGDIMDKFGIFNLLNSFLNFNNAKNEQNPKNENSNTASETQPLAQGLANLFSSLNGNPNAQKTTSQPQQAQQPKPPVMPLQNSMLSTMNSHDEFVKRVKRKQPQK